MKGKILVNEIPASGITVEIGDHIDWVKALLIEASEIEKGGRGEGSFHIQKKGDVVIVKVSLKGETSQQCSRCLDEAKVPFSGEYTLYFDPPGRWKRLEGEIELKPEDLQHLPYDGVQIDLKEILREHIHLSIPIKPLCENGCAGLCPICGKNLNRGACNCEEKESLRLRGVLLKDRE